MYNNYIWSLYKIGSALVEDSEAWTLLQRFPHAGPHDSGSYFFVSSLTNAVDPLVIDNSQPVEDMVKQAKDAIKDPSQVNAVWLTKSEAVFVYAEALLMADGEQVTSNEIGVEAW